MDYSSCPNLAAMFFAQAERRGDRPFLWAKRGGGAYAAISWREAARRVRALSRGLRSLGLRPGDRVALVSENRPEWVIADLAVIAAGAATVPAYVTNTIEDHRHVLASSGVRIVIVSTPALAQRVIPAADQVDSAEHVIAIEPAPIDQVAHTELHRWDDILALGAEQPDDVADQVARLTRDDVACIIFTSGTGGVPKGVMLTHGNIIANCRGAYHLLEAYGIGDEVFLCFLPLSHAYEHTAGMMFPISLGAEIYFAEGAETLATNMQEARPTIMTAVPRLYETMHQRILRSMERQRGLRAKLFFKALELGKKRYESPRSLTLGDRMTDVVVDRLVRDKIRARFGGRLKAMVSGGGPLTPEIGLFFIALGVNLLQGYGQTEASPVISANPPARIKIDTVGPPLDGTEVRIAEDGEILVRGDSVMKGYWNDPESTARVIRSGWLHTGDVGEIDRDGYLRITDRKRDFIKTSGGEMISPARVEGLLTLQPEIAQVMVFGDRRPYLVAVVVPDAEFATRFARENKCADDLAALSENAAFQKAVGGAVARVNRELPSLERVRRFVVAGEPFSISNGQLTPTMKIKRHAIRQRYGDLLLALYDGKGAAA